VSWTAAGSESPRHFQAVHGLNGCLARTRKPQCFARASWSAHQPSGALGSGDPSAEKLRLACARKRRRSVSKTLARQPMARANAKRLGLRRPSAAFVRARPSHIHNTHRALEKRQGLAHSKTLARLSSRLQILGPSRTGSGCKAPRRLRTNRGFSGELSLNCLCPPIPATAQTPPRSAASPTGATA
jgi:hypothetical protein